MENENDSGAIAIDAIQYIGSNLDEVEKFTNGNATIFLNTDIIRISHVYGSFESAVGEWIVKMSNRTFCSYSNHWFKTKFAEQIKEYKEQIKLDASLNDLLKTQRSVLVYVAGPYIGTPDEINFNIERAEAVSINLIRQGFSVYTPHKNCSHYEKYEDDRLTVDTWFEMGLNVLSRCDAIYVMEHTDETSTGTLAEIDFAYGNYITVLRESEFASDDITINDYLHARYAPGEKYDRKLP